MIIPTSVNNTLDKKVPNNTKHNALQFANTASTAATSSAMRLRESTFEATYSQALRGETAKKEVTLWLFSNNIIAHMKKSPIAAGSE